MQDSRGRRIGVLPGSAVAVAGAVFAAMMVGACGGDLPVRPEVSPPLAMDAQVNVQLGDTPVGAQPVYIVTGRVKATEGGRTRETVVDSIVVEYARNTGAWTRARRTKQLPFDDVLPFTVAAGDVYRLMARLYGSALDEAGERHTVSAEWAASGAALVP